MPGQQEPLGYNEASVLIALYEAVNGTHSTYTLASQLRPSASPDTQEGLSAFLETREATEHLIEKGFVHGVRKTGVNGVYFESLKLTRKGERAAIHERTATEKAKESEHAKSAEQIAKDFLDPTQT